MVSRSWFIVIIVVELPVSHVTTRSLSYINKNHYVYTLAQFSVVGYTL
jgi:hypothetical protein